MYQKTDIAPTPELIEKIELQIGRAPRGIQAISATDSLGTPLVVRMHSIVDKKPFPTLYWMTSELLKKEISHIEARGEIKALEERLIDDPEFLAQYHASHQNYVDQRWQYMTEEERVFAEQAGFLKLLKEKGIGGIANWDTVRCLHTQYAHHLCGQNVVGQWMDETFGIADLIP